jgi:hypothetical protein
MYRQPQPAFAIHRQVHGLSREEVLFSQRRSAEQQHTLPGLNQITHDRDCAENRPADATCETDNLARSVTDGGDAVKRTLDTGAVIATERADALSDEREIRAINLAIRERKLTTLKTSFGHPAEIHDDLHEIVIAFAISCFSDGFRNSRWEHREQNIEIVGAGELVRRSNRVTSPVQ